MHTTERITFDESSIEKGTERKLVKLDPGVFPSQLSRFDGEILLLGLGLPRCDCFYGFESNCLSR
jgi:hypothetical protein